MLRKPNGRNVTKMNNRYPALTPCLDKWQTIWVYIPEEKIAENGIEILDYNTKINN